MAYKISKEAVKDLTDIGKYTEQVWGKAQRRRYLSLLEKKFNAVSERPLQNRERFEFHPPVRIQHFLAHLIVYLVITDGILIVRVLHKNMAIENQLV